MRKRALVCAVCDGNGYNADNEFLDGTGYVCTLCHSNNYYNGGNKDND